MTVSFEDFTDCMTRVQRQLAIVAPCINNGGCAFFAVELMKIMECFEIMDAKIAIFGHDPFFGDDVPNVEYVYNELLENDVDIDDPHVWNDNGIRFAHLAVEWRGIHFDGLSTFEKDTYGIQEFQKYPGEMPFDCAERLAYQDRGWNPMYDRRLNPEVVRVLDKCFESLL